MDQECARRGLPASAPGESLTKAQRLATVLDRVPEADYPAVLQRFLEVGGRHAARRNQVQDLLWTGPQYPEITVRARREVLAALDEAGEDITSWDAVGLKGLLGELWDLECGPGLWVGAGAWKQVQSVLSRPGGRCVSLGMRWAVGVQPLQIRTVPPRRALGAGGPR